MNARCSRARLAGIVPLLLALLASGAHADPEGGTVSGVVKPSQPASARSDAPRRNRGFLDRVPNPFKPPRSPDPLPHIIVVLEGGEAHPDDLQASRRPVRYRLIGASFEVPVLPVLVGSAIEIRNAGKGSPRLYSPTHPGLLEEVPLGKKADIKKIETANQVVEIRDRDSAHLRGRIVAFDTPYFARVDDGGKFEISGVPAGTWNLRLWYQDGWLEVPPQPIEVRARGQVKVKTIEVSIGLAQASGGEEG